MNLAVAPRRPRRLAYLPLVAAVLWFLSPLQAAAQPEPDLVLQEIRGHLRIGQYDEAIEILQKNFEEGTGTPERSQQLYLLLIETYVLLANDFRSRGDFVTSDLYADRAKEETQKCLETWELRHTRPVPEINFPPEMVRLFRDVRSEVLGAFRVIELTPPDAFVVLAGDTLMAAAGDSLPSALDLPVGTYWVEARADGYGSHGDEIVISPGTTLERSYELNKKRGTLWYASRVAAAGGAVVGAVLLLGGDGTTEPVIERVLDFPPPPPD